MRCLIAIVCSLLALSVESAPSDTKYLSVDDVPKCAEGDEHVGDCIKKILNIMIPRLKEGNAELKMLPYEPFILNRTSFQYTSGPVNGRITVRSAKIYGFSSLRFTDIALKMDGDKVKVRAVSLMPKMNILGKYKADMQINTLQLKPKGDFNVTLYDVETTSVTDGELYKKNGHRFLRLTSLEANPKINDLTIKANGIFADPSLDDLILNVANQYWKDIYGIMLPETRLLWQPMLMRMLNEALEYVPIDQFVADSQ